MSLHQAPVTTTPPSSGGSNSNSGSIMQPTNQGSGLGPSILVYSKGKEYALGSSGSLQPVGNPTIYQIPSSSGSGSSGSGSNNGSSSSNSNGILSNLSDTDIILIAGAIVVVILLL